MAGKIKSRILQIDHRLRLGAIYVIILMLGVLTVLVLELVTVRTEQQRQLQNYRESITNMVARADARLNAYTTLSQNLAAFMDLDETDPSTKFASLAGVLSQNNQSIVNIAMSDPYVVTDVYPFEPNKAALGLDFRTRPDLLPSVETALESGKPFVHGPIDLVQGGKGIIVRSASQTNGDRAYSVVIDVASFLTEIGVFDIPTDGLVSVRSSTTEIGAPFVGADAVWSSTPVIARIQLNDTAALIIGAAPKEGWAKASPHRAEIIAVVIGLLMISYGGVNYARRLIKDRAKARRQLVAAIESLEDGFVVYDEDDRLLLCNQKYKNYYTKSADLFVPGMSFEHIIREGVARGQYLDAEGHEEEWIAERLALHNNPTEPSEQRLPDGRWLKVSESKTHDGYTVGFRVDISELKSALVAAEQASAAKTDFLNNMSHELRTPLAIILGYVAFLKNVAILPSYGKIHAALADDESKQELLETFARDISKQAEKSDSSGKHLMALIDSVLDWSKLSNNRVDLEITPVDLDGLLGGLVAELSDNAVEKSVELSYQGEPCMIYADEMRLRQVFINLASNALKFTEEGMVRITMESADQGIVVKVEDSGPGIPEDRISAIFERFEQVDASTKRKFGGTGLGLAICKSLVELHDGSISAQSVFGEGSTFTVTLPKSCLIEARSAA